MRPAKNVGECFEPIYFLHFYIKIRFRAFRRGHLGAPMYPASILLSGIICSMSQEEECVAPLYFTQLRRKSPLHVSFSAWTAPRNWIWCEALSCTSPLWLALRVKSEVSTFRVTFAVSIKVLVRVSELNLKMIICHFSWSYEDPILVVEASRS